MIFRINLMMIYGKKMNKIKLKLITYKNNMKKKFLNLENNSMMKNFNQKVFIQNKHNNKILIQINILKSLI